MASSFDEAARANQQAADALAARDAAKRRAATVNPQQDTSAAIARRVKAAGDGAWGSHPDATYAQASGKRRT